MAVHALKGEITVPGDKSISHRAVMFAALAEGDTRIRHFLNGADCLSTISCFRQLGVSVETDPSGSSGAGDVVVHGAGLHGLKQSSGILDAGNSGTTMRLLSGILAGQRFSSELTGDSSLRKRPMKRIMDPLTDMGAAITSKNADSRAPLLIAPARLHGIHYLSPVASAQVKSCVLLAGLYADGETSVTEPVLSRNHTELMLRAFGAHVESSGTTCIIAPEPALHPQDIDVPGDISSAAYFIAAACIVPGSEVLIRSVGINPTRDGIIRAARAMGADITLLNERILGGEPAADLLVKNAPLKGCTIEGELIPTLIDELPVLAVMAAFADGTTVIRDAAELKVKESDRIAVMTENLQRMGADVTPTDDGMIIRGGRPLNGAVIDPHADHRIAMSFAVASLAARGEVILQDRACVSISYPQFFADLESLTK